MPRQAPRERRPEALQALLQHPNIQALIQQQATLLPADAGRWLGQLCLLYGVPFNNLVADARMLPPESIRFFFVDQNWLDSLVDGALSVANLNSQDNTMIQLLRPQVRQRAGAAARAERRRLRLIRLKAPPAATDSQSAAEDGNPPVWSGFLLRSAAVADWPGLNVTAYTDICAQSPLQLLRLDRPAPNVMIAIFDGIAQRFDIAKPAQALHFGVEDDKGPTPYSIFLRGIGDAQTAGVQLPGNPAADVPLRDDPKGRRVLDVSGLQDNIWNGLLKAYSPSTPPPLNPGAFALEMVAGTERQSFTPLQILKFSATPPQIAPGESSTLAWQVINADTCQIEPDGVPVNPASGTYVVRPGQTTSYTLDASQCGVSTSSSVTVTVAAVATTGAPAPGSMLGARVRPGRPPESVADLLGELRHDP